MTVEELINAVILKATGKANTLQPGTPKWDKVLGIANAYQKVWQHEPSQHWNSLYDPAHVVGTVSGKNAYELYDEIDAVSTSKGDDIYIEGTNGQKVNYQLVAYDDLKNYPTGRFCAVIGRQLVFNSGFSETDPEYGGKIHAPIFRNVENLENKNDEVAVDDPMWLVFMSAAEYIRNDIVKQNQYGNLIAEANNLMTDMIRRNRAGQVRKIRGNWHNGGGSYASEGTF